MKNIYMGVFGLFSLLLTGAAFALAVTYEKPIFWFVFALGVIFVLADARVETRKSNKIGQLHLISEKGEFKAVGFEFKVPVEEIVGLSEVSMDVHIDDCADMD